MRLNANPPIVQPSSSAATKSARSSARLKNAASIAYSINGAENSVLLKNSHTNSSPGITPLVYSMSGLTNTNNAMKTAYISGTSNSNNISNNNINNNSSTYSSVLRRSTRSTSSALNNATGNVNIPTSTFYKRYL
jgi:hypothetical protein